MANNKTMELLSTLENQLLKEIVNQNVESLYEEIQPKVEHMIMEEFGMVPKRIEVKTPNSIHTVTAGVTHEKFEEVLKIVGLDIPVYLTGKAGTGKNVICKQVAEALGLDFYFTNAVSQEYKLTGFIDANGNFHETQFFKAFTQGGVFFLDEMDASIPEVLVILNAAIANRYFDFPTGKVEAHPDFRVIAAGNTVGGGADNNYTGRYALDKASLDRFAMVDIDYSPAIEKAVTGNDLELINFAHNFRKSTENAGLECLFSYRSLERIAKLSKVFDDIAELLDICLLKGMSKDDLTVLVNELEKNGGMNKYVDAVKRLSL